MKHRLLLAVLLLPLVATPVLAKQGSDDGDGHRRHHAGAMERMDTDQDGRISRAEFDTRRQTPTFEALDANRDGYIVRSEARAYYERMRPQREAERKARFEQRFTEADLNRDGKLGRAEVSENMPRMADRFAWLDENRDGFLTRAELANGRGGH